MIHIKNDREIKTMREVGKITSMILTNLIINTNIGDTGLDIDRRAKKLFDSVGVESAFLHLYGFPAHLCISTNEYVLHGIPNSIPFKDGDVIKMDIGSKYKGFNSDMARTFILGKPTNENHLKLIDANKKALDLAISVVKDGVETNEISRQIENFVKTTTFASVDAFGGHGIGVSLHEPPKIFNAIKKDQPNTVLKTNMVICIEPILLLTGTGELIFETGNKWAIKTPDNCIGSHFEDMIAVRKSGYEILTR